MAGTKFYNGLDLQSQKATNAADGSAPTDLVTKQQLDNAIAGLAWKAPVRVATTANGTLSSAFTNGQSVDGVTLATGDRILLKNQTTGSENGVYVVAASGAPTRATDADSSLELNAATVYVTAGTANADKAFTQTADSITLGSTSLVWAQVGGGTSYSAGNGLTLAGSTFSVQAADSSISVAVGGISTSRSAIGAIGRYAQDVGALTAGTPLTITHNLGTLDVDVTVRVIATGEVVDLGAVVASTNTVTVQSATSQSSGVFRIVVMG